MASLKPGGYCHRNDVTTRKVNRLFEPSGKKKTSKSKLNGRTFRSRIIITPRIQRKHTVLIDSTCIYIYRLEARLRLTTGATRVYLASSCCRTFPSSRGLSATAVVSRRREKGGKKQEVIDCPFRFCRRASLTCSDPQGDMPMMIV